MPGPIPAEIERARRAFVDERVSVWFEQPPNFEPRNTSYFRILDELTQDIASQSDSNAMGAEWLRERYLDAEGLFSWLQSAAAEATGQSSDSEGWWNLWRHTMRDPREIKHADFPYIDTSENSHLAHYVPAYLAQRARSRRLDRIYVDMLIASELFVRADAVHCRYVEDKADQRRRLEHVADLLLCDGIMLLYAKLSPDRSPSAAEIAEDARALVPCGAKWPTLLDDLLNDVMSRGGML